MKVSYNWLQNYFDTPLPSPEKLAELLTFHVFEIESIEKVQDDFVLDVKVLPDRACYALSHKGIAYEIGAITNLPQKTYPISTTSSEKRKVGVVVENSEACPRYMARKIEGISMAPAPDWLKNPLITLGQRSINSIVDEANLSLLDLGQPLHVFDADKIVGNITVRFAKSGEKITTLDNKEITLDDSVLIIADEKSPLAIAGIKGGNRAEVTESTKNIIIESANFDASLIRKTSTKIGIKTDASKRYENGITPDLVPEAMEKMSALVQTINNPKAISEITDIYPHPLKPRSLEISKDYISERLGIILDEKTISDILNRLKISHAVSDDIFSLTIPTWRRDLTIPEDIVEEVGRIYGYDKIHAKLLPEISFKPKVIKSFYYENKIKDILVELGFSEVYTYALKEKGDIELEKSAASDKNFMRKDLRDGIQKSLELNAHNADLLGLDQIKIFEIGTVFTKKGENTALALGVKNAKKLKVSEKEVLEHALKKLSEVIGIHPENLGKASEHILEVNLTEIIKDLPEPKEYEKFEIKKEVKKYEPFSIYPFATRDIAVFTPENTKEEDVRKIIENNAGNILVKNTLFDVFTKEFPEGKKISYAFRLVLQSKDKTLTEEEINSIMKKITYEMNSREGWMVR